MSVYRIDGRTKNLALYIAFSVINGFYTGTSSLNCFLVSLSSTLQLAPANLLLFRAAFWDVFMDFSLLQSHAHHRYLRDITALKSRWPYYLIMIIDPILRFNWIFYAIFTHDTQHSSIASFLIAFSEVTRRGMWTLLRVENEHCSNVAQYKASRDVPLPYQLDTDVESPTRLSIEPNGGAGGKQQQDDELVASPSKAAVSWTGDVLRRVHSGKSTGVEVPGSASARRAAAGAGGADGGPSTAEEGGQAPGEEAQGMRRRQRADTIGRRSITRILADAHKQDFEKKRKPADQGRAGQLAGPDEAEEEEEFDEDEDDEDDYGEETGSLLDERLEVREAEMLSRKGKDDYVED